MNRRNLALIAIAAAAALVLAWSVQRHREPLAPAPSTVAATLPSLKKIQLRPLRPPPAVPVMLSDEDEAFVDKLRDKFALHVGDKHAQIKLIEQILAYLEAHGLTADLARAHALLKSLFPELADELFAKLQNLIAYDQWLAENRSVLAGMDTADRRAALWETRTQLFGDDAREIWAGELRSEQMRASLEALQSAPQLTTEEKLEKYVDSIHEAYGDRAPEVIERQQTELLDAFLELDSVQQDLAAMPPDQRRENLHHVRSAMGMDPAALERWDELDHQRDSAWSRGQEYMRERAQLAAQYPAVEQDQRLQGLQDRLFGAEAETIRAEEAAGFFRYGHPRRIGRE